MSWYKTALTQNEFYEFYTLQGFDNETLEDHPEILFRLVDSINNIKQYYLKYLFEQIADELRHFFSMYEDRRLEPGRSKIFDIVSSLILRLRRCRENSDLCDLSRSDMDQIIGCFNKYGWGHGAYGGSLWGQIATWGFKLYEVGEIKIQKYSLGFMEKIREAIMIIDAIHSLHHNTSIALKDLPNNERSWLPVALEVVKSVEHPVELSDLSGNVDLSKIYRREVFPLKREQHYMDEKIKLMDSIARMDGIKTTDLARNTTNHEIMQILLYALETRHSVFLDLCGNSHVAQYLDIVKGLYDHSKGWAAVELESVAHSSLITEDVAKFLARICVNSSEIKYALIDNLKVPSHIRSTLVGENT